MYYVTCEREWRSERGIGTVGGCGMIREVVSMGNQLNIGYLYVLITRDIVYSFPRVRHAPCFHQWAVFKAGGLRHFMYGLWGNSPYACLESMLTVANINQIKWLTLPLTNKTSKSYALSFSAASEHSCRQVHPQHDQSRTTMLYGRIWSITLVTQHFGVAITGIAYPFQPSPNNKTNCVFNIVKLADPSPSEQRDACHYP